ncbi:MAG: helix-turn-helix domain-containing protein [Parachlamydiales bacterium]|jgi:DNA-binding transcriptional ArsR family regulator
MKHVIEDLKKFLFEAWGFEVNPKRIESKNNLPVFLKNLYFLYSVDIFDRSYLLAVARNPEDAMPSQVSKHVVQIEKIFNMSCIYVAKALPAYIRQRLVSFRVRFIIPNTQMYFPDLGLYYRKISSKTNIVPQSLLPSAQAVVIYALLHGCREFTPSELAKKLSYSRMTMTRSLNELEAAGLGKTVRKGKERCFHFLTEKDILWKQAMPFLNTPIKEILWIQISNSTFKKIMTLAVIAGISALSLHSDLNAPACPVFAVFQNTWKTLIKSEAIKQLPISEGASMQIEIWNYDPQLFDKDNIVDPLSLYLSLKDNEDERVQKAVMNFMEKMKW